MGQAEAHTREKVFDARMITVNAAHSDAEGGGG
jgi:hypothetical protein